MPNPTEDARRPQTQPAAESLANGQGIIIPMLRLTLAMQGLSPDLDPFVKAIRNRLRQGTLDADGLAALDQISNDLLRAKNQSPQNSSLSTAEWEQSVCRSFATFLELPDEKNAAFLTLCAHLSDQIHTEKWETLRRFFSDTPESQPKPAQPLKSDKTEFAGFFSRFFARYPATQGTSPPMNVMVLSLLQSISWPEAWKFEVDQFCLRLQKNPRDDEWKQVLESLGGLITKVVSTIERETHGTEDFLSHLFSNLQSLEEFLGNAREDSLESLNSTLDLNQFFLGEAVQINSSFVKLANIQQVQQTIAGRLDAIRRKLFAHVEAARERMNRAESRKLELQQQLSKVEAEADTLRQQIVLSRRQAMRDALTGLPNRLAYQERLDQEFKHWIRFQKPLALIVWDVDNFKGVNDCFGHQVGDKALRAIAEVLQKRLRQTDFIARYGGEEFVALLVGSDLTQAQEVATEIRRAVEGTRFYANNRQIPLTISCGISQFNGDDTPERVFGRADQALYQAKQSGKNRCVIAS